MDDLTRLREFLAGQAIMVVAVTLEDGTPWATPVKIQRQVGREFEWDSRLDTLHSRTLEVHPNMAITIFQKQADIQFGFYAQGKASLVSESPGGFGRYRFVAERTWINDESFVKREVELV